MVWICAGPQLYGISEGSSAVVASLSLLVLAETNELVVIEVDGFGLTRVLGLFFEQLSVDIRRRSLASLKD